MAFDYDGARFLGSNMLCFCCFHMEHGTRMWDGALLWRLEDFKKQLLMNEISLPCFFLYLFGVVGIS